MKARDDGRRFKRRLTHEHLVRLHMALILTAVIASGVLASKLMLMAHVHWFALRYPLAVLTSYSVFLALVRLWIWYVASRQTLVPDFVVGSMDDLPSFRGGGSGFQGFGGGSSGGGGASSSWESAVASDISQPVASGGGGGHSWFGFDFDLDLDGEGWLVLILLVALVLTVVLAGGYLVWAAPQILPEAAWQAVLAGTLTRISKQDHHDWMPGILKSTAIPFALVLLFATALGWAAHHYCPTAVRLVDLLNCPG